MLRAVPWTRDLRLRFLVLLLLVFRGTLGCGPTPLPALTSSQPLAGASSVPTSAWVILHFASPVGGLAPDAFGVVCGGASQAVTTEILGTDTVVLNPLAALPPAASCTVSWSGPSGPTSLSFLTLAAASSPKVLYDRDVVTGLAPFPDDYWLTPDASTATGLRVDAPVPDRTPDVETVYTALLAEVNKIDGFSPSGPIVVELDQPLWPQSVPRTSAESLDPLASVALFDLDPTSPSYGQRVPFQLTPRGDTTSQSVTGYTIVIFPSVPLRPRGRYGLVVTNRALSLGGQPLAPSPFFASVLAAPTGVDTPAVVRARAAVADVLDFVEAASPAIPRDDLALALSVHVRSTDTIPLDLAVVRADVFSQPPPAWTITSVQQGFGGGVAAVVRGTWQAPDYRSGANFARDGQGRPVRQSTRPIPFVLAIPTTALAHPAPIVIHQHGNPGSAEFEVESNASYFLAPAGFAVIGFTDVLNREVSSDLVDQVQAAFGGILANRKIPDYWAETHAEQIAFVRMIQGLGSLDVLPVGAPDGRPDLDVAAPLAYHGISEGANHGPGILPYLPEIRSAALVAGGARLGEVLVQSPEAAPLLLQQLPQVVPGLTPSDIWVGVALFQAGYDVQDAHNHAPFLYRMPLSLGGDGRRASVLLQEGLGDALVPNDATEALANGLGPIAQLGVKRPVPFLPVATAPLSANVDALTTAALTQYVPAVFPGLPPTPGCEFQYEGHFCPQVAAPARDQRVAFFQSALQAGAPVVIDPLQDTDGDGLTDVAETTTYHTNPANADSDGDGMQDGVEVTNGLDPLRDDAALDPDGDGLSNAEELAQGTSPKNADSDYDGLADGVEVEVFGTAPTSYDTDADGLADGAEILKGSDPHLADSDGDGLSDAAEIGAGLDPVVADAAEDPDGDGLSNADELSLGTLPFRADSDGDGLPDGAEVNVYHTSPLSQDSDRGSRADGTEVTKDGTNPLDPSDDVRDALGPLVDGDGFSWDPTRDGVIRFGTNRAFAYGGFTNYLYTAPGPLVGAEDGGRELVFPPYTGYPPGVRVGRKLFVPTDAGFARFLEILENTGSAPTTVSLQLRSAFGTFGTESVVATSDGDTTFETTDDYVVTDDGPGGASAIAHVVAGPGATVRPTSVLRYSGALTYIYTITVPAHGRAIVLEFGVQSGDGPTATAHAEALRNLQGSALRGLAPDERMDVVNFAPPPDADGDRLADADEAAYGTSPTDPDSDHDGLPDGFEVRFRLDPLNGSDAGADPDGDGLSNLRERTTGTDPALADSDGDGLLDGEEVDAYATDPLRADSDGDGLLDGFEVRSGFDPHAYTYEYGDTDGDGLVELDEQRNGTDPRQADTDGDGLRDRDEVYAGLDPTNPADAVGDADGDGLGNLDEAARGTSISSVDTDGDGIGDGIEVRRLGTDPTKRDSDGDGLGDGEELQRALDPLRADSDGDGISDGVEVSARLDPRNPADAELDPDGDGLTNLEEIAYGTDASMSDTDGDGLGDGAEVHLYQSNPALADSDGGGRNDGAEMLQDGTDPLDRFDDRVSRSLPVYTTDGQGRSWRIQGDGALDLSSSNTALLRALRSPIYGVAASGVVEGDKLELVLQPTTSGGIVARRKILVPSDESFARVLDILENPTSTPALVPVDLVSDLRTDLDIGVVATSNADGVLDARDRSFVLDDAIAEGGAAATTEVFSGAGARLQPTSVSTDVRRGGTVTIHFDVPVPARGRAILLHFVAQSASLIEAQFYAGSLSQPQRRALFDLTDDERRDVVNFALAPDADGDGVVDADDNCPAVRNASQGDADHDGRGDSCDNCLLDPNPSQRDSNRDGFGNACDPDIDNNLEIDIGDLNRIDQASEKRRGQSGYDPDADLDGDGVVGLPDFNLLRDRYGTAPGPSAMPCAGHGSVFFPSPVCSPY